MKASRFGHSKRDATLAVQQASAGFTTEVMSLHLSAIPPDSEWKLTARDCIITRGDAAGEPGKDEIVEAPSRSSVHSLGAYVEASEAAKQRFELNSFRRKPRANCKAVRGGALFSIGLPVTNEYVTAPSVANGSATTRS